MSQKYLSTISISIALALLVSLQTGCSSTRPKDPQLAVGAYHMNDDWNKENLEDQTEDQPIRLAPSGKPRVEPKKLDTCFSEDQAIVSVVSDLSPSQETLLLDKESSAYQAANTGKKYTVKKGDSLWVIAKKYNLKVEDLMLYNGLSKNCLLKIGQILIIPDCISSTPSLAIQEEPLPEMETYVVRRGDTLSELAMVSSLSIDKLQSFNNLKTTTIYLDQKIQVPCGTTEKMIALKKTQSQKAQAMASNPNGDTYTVRPGDTLSDIANHTGNTVAKIMEMNTITDPRKLRAGQVLRIEKGLAPNVQQPQVSQLLSLEPKSTQEMNPSTPPSNISEGPISNTQSSHTLSPVIEPASMEDEMIFNNTEEAPILQVQSS